MTLMSNPRPLRLNIKLTRFVEARQFTFYLFPITFHLIGRSPINRNLITSSHRLRGTRSIFGDCNLVNASTIHVCNLESETVPGDKVAFRRHFPHSLEY